MPVMAGVSVNAAIGYQCRHAPFGINRQVFGLALLALGEVARTAV
jgi:hypothetical protein